ncbi:MAG TPA: HEAT repeat domain-containing protein [Longimicrobium sp.]|nr:HEAT repeat domain-containing protein [Longimicrobium sp.]
MPPSIRELIDRLGAGSEAARRESGDALLRLGEPAVAALAHVLADAGPEIRKPAAFLLGRAGDASPAVVAALTRALADEESKVRKNAAVALGRLGAAAAVEPLGRALAAEEMLWVRPSLVLALGALGTPAAAVLRTVEPRSPEEAEALRKALDRAGDGGAGVRWKHDGRLPVAPHLAVPPGLEAVAAAEAVERGLAEPVRVREGLLACAPAPYGALFPVLRCVYAVRYPLASGPRLSGVPEDQLPGRVAALVRGAGVLGAWREWIDAPDGVLRYRFSLTGLRVARPTLRAVLEGVRAALRPLGMGDSPSAYAAELQVEAARDGAHLLLTPTFVPDDRFAYRVEDVGASIHPVVGACLARLARTPGASLACDPTCGSATLLIERARLDDVVRCRGTDVSPTAVRAATANVAAAGLTPRISITRGDACDPEHWAECDEVLANLPFGLRTRRADGDHARLYAGIAANLARALRPGGRAVLYTSDRQALRAAFAGQARALTVRETLTTRSGGLDVGVWVIERR